MFVKGKIVFVIVICVVLARPSKQEKPEDCVKGKQFWSRHSIKDDGACVSCPFHWQNCYNEHIDDQKRCVDSCHVNPKSVQVKVASAPAFVSTTIPTPTSASPEALRGPDKSISVLSTSTRYPKEPNADQNNWILIVAVALPLFGFAIAIVIVLAMRSTGRLRRNREKRDPENPNEPQSRLLRNGKEQRTNGEQLHVADDVNLAEPGNNRGQVSHEPERSDDDLAPPIQERIKGIQEEAKCNGSTSFLNEINT